jgi:hypothetical protein
VGLALFDLVGVVVRGLQAVAAFGYFDRNDQQLVGSGSECGQTSDRVDVWPTLQDLIRFQNETGDEQRQNGACNSDQTALRAGSVGDRLSGGHRKALCAAAERLANVAHGPGRGWLSVDGKKTREHIESIELYRVFPA